MIERSTGYGISTADIIHLLRQKMSSHYKNIDFRNVPPSKTYLLFDEIPKAHAFVVGLHPRQSSTIGHMVIFFKDINGKLGVIDPQLEHVCYNEQCTDYLAHFNDEIITVFVGQKR
jgi:hypothetical protein